MHTTLCPRVCILQHGKTHFQRERPPPINSSAEGADGRGQSTAFCSCPRARKCTRCPGAPKLVHSGPEGAAPGVRARATKQKLQLGRTHDPDLTQGYNSTFRLTACAHGRRPDNIGILHSLTGSSARAGGARVARGWQWRPNLLASSSLSAWFLLRPPWSAAGTPPRRSQHRRT